MGFSFFHLLFFLAVVLLFFGPSKLPQLGSSIGEFTRNFKKSLNGEGDIDVTDSAKRLPKDEKDS